MKILKVTDNHIKLLKNLYISWDDCEFGGPRVDPKRPFGNSDVIGDIATILDIKLPNEEDDYDNYQKVVDNLQKGYYELQDCLQILCINLSIETRKCLNCLANFCQLCGIKNKEKNND